MSTTRPAPRCLVIGGSGTVGRALCATLAANGAQVSLTYRSRRDAAESVCASLGGESSGARAFALDVIEPGATARVVRDAARNAGGALDALVYAAAIGTARPGVYERFDDIDEAAWDLLMTVNVRGAFAATQAFASVIPDDGRGGNVVLVGSVDGVKPLPASAHYATSKGALAAMARVVAKDLGRRNVRVNVLAPGLLTDGLSTIAPEELRREYLKHSALKRFGEAREVAATAAWLALENRYVTGRTLTLDGGL